MTTPFPQRFAQQLSSHPDTPCPLVESITVAVDRFENGAAKGLQFSYRLAGQLPQLRLPPPAQEPGHRDELWKHTCFEAFLGVPGSSAYLELNFSPSGNWAVYAFKEERIRDTVSQNLAAPIISIAQGENEFILGAQLTLPKWIKPGDDLRLGLTAVIETQDSRLSYWALHHPAERPDFHRKDGWTEFLTTP